MSKESSETARQRAQVILQVQNGTITATEGARRLGVSRKTYYQWEKRALEGMIAGLETREPGRPPSPPVDPEKIHLHRKVADLEQRLEMMADVYDLRRMLEEFRHDDQRRGRQAKAGKKKR